MDWKWSWLSFSHNGIVLLILIIRYFSSQISCCAQSEGFWNRINKTSCLHEYSSSICHILEGSLLVFSSSLLSVYLSIFGLFKSQLFKTEGERIRNMAGWSTSTFSLLLYEENRTAVSIFFSSSMLGIRLVVCVWKQHVRVILPQIRNDGQQS